MTDPLAAPVSSLVLAGRLTTASNATFVGDLAGVRVVYKPIAGERPLWDFPDGNLASREVAAYAVSEALGWGVVPRTWLGEGPHGVGMLQEWIVEDPRIGAVDVVAPGSVPAGFRTVLDARDGQGNPVLLVHEDTPALRRMAVFDALINNGDRKGGHVLATADGQRRGVDHGVSFHVENKLRTVLWGWLGEALWADETAAVRRVAADGALAETLRGLITANEVEAFLVRAQQLLATGTFPEPSAEWPAIPWPAF
jgi:uncharacterized repeat protein (TIGR03843 family)